MAQVGRISGPLLQANLLRDGRPSGSPENNLAFRNTLNDTQLLFLDVNNGYVGVNTGTPSQQLDINGTMKATDLTTGPSTVDGFSVSNGKFEAIGNIFLNAAEVIKMPALENGTLRINDNNISSIASSSDIDISANGTGNVNINSNLNVTGNLSATGNITLDGTINFGDTVTQDTVDFEADVNSDIIPDQNHTYNLGRQDKRWNYLYTNLVNGEQLTAENFSVGGINFSAKQGNIFYVAQNGTDTNQGDHPQAPVSSIRRALELVDASIGGPVAIYVFAGDYEEETPLVVPPNVTIVGADLRNTVVFPTSYTLSEDVFHLNGETTIQNLTIKNFYYDDNKGYAFRFAPDGVISSRSPYIQNCTVITQGTNTSSDDPRGFESGDAGKGAYIDGAELNSASIEASMLFHSCTFITPGVDAITMTNGVRVEWLNSFTYFANRGLYAFNNSTGRILQDGSTLGYGAELRSIGSASVYGNYGAVADGNDCLMYLIQHNFGYVGAGKFVDNDKSRSLQVQEVVEENNGKIYYVTTDHTGNYRVGDNFVIDFETGRTSIDLSSLTADSLNGIIVTTNNNITTIRGDKIETGNIRISDNTIRTLSGDLTLDSATNIINLTNNTNISENLDITGNLSFDGSLNLLGNQITDTLTFNVDFDQNFNPNQTLSFNLGSPSKNWLVAHLSRLESGDISIYDNVIETNVSNADLEFRASGTGKVVLPANAVISNALTVVGTSTLQDLVLNGALNFTGNTNITGNTLVTKNITVSEQLVVGAKAQFEGILVDDNFITTTTSNSNLELRAAGTGNILVPNADAVITNNLQVSNDTFLSDVNNSQQVSAIEFNNGTISITGNEILTVVSNADLDLVANNIVRFEDNTSLGNDLTINGASSVQSLTINGILNQTGNRNQTGNFTQGGELQVDNVYVEDNFITTLESNSNLDLRATGNISVDSNNVEIAQDLTVSGATSLQGTTITGTVTHVGDRTQTGNLDVAGEISNGNILIEDNFITTTNTNSDLELRAAGTGEVVIDPSDSFTINNNLFVGGVLDYQGTLTINGNVVLKGNVQEGSLIVTDNFNITGTLDISSQAQFENILIEDNFITTTDSNSDLELRASGTGNVVSSSEVNILQNLSTRNITADNIDINGDITLNEIDIPPSVIEIDDNFISTKISNANLELRSTTGSNLIFTENTIITQDLTVNGTTNIISPNITGTITHTGNRSQNNVDITGNLTISGFINSDREFHNLKITIDDNFITTVTNNDNLELRASGSGSVVFQELTEIRGNISANNLTTENININDGLNLEFLESSTDIKIFDNVITTTNSNSNLELRTAGTGSVYLQNLEMHNGVIENTSPFDSTSRDIIFEPTENMIVNSTGALIIPVGSAFVGNTGDIRLNSDSQIFESTGATNIINYGGVFSANKQTSVTADSTSNTLRFIINGAVNPLDSTNLVGEVNSQSFSIHSIQVDDISFDNNTIVTNVSNSNLDLVANGTGEFKVGNFTIKDNLLKGNNNPLTFKNTDFGYVKFNTTKAIAIPAGTNGERPVADPEIGDTRWNTDGQQLETWDGTAYVSAAGDSAGISASEFNDLLLEYTIIFG